MRENSKERPVRKHVRLKDYDYGGQGVYFATVCTIERREVLSTVVVGPDAHIGPALALTDAGRVVERFIRSVDTAYKTVFAEHYVIMPNHIHLLLRFEGAGGGPMRASGPTLGSVIRSLKGLVTRKLGRPIWQDGYHEHIIRDENDFLTHWAYIDANPARWAEDEYYFE